MAVLAAVLGGDDLGVLSRIQDRPSSAQVGGPFRFARRWLLSCDHLRGRDRGCDRLPVCVDAFSARGSRATAGCVRSGDCHHRSWQPPASPLLAALGFLVHGRCTSRSESTHHDNGRVRAPPASFLQCWDSHEHRPRPGAWKLGQHGVTRCRGLRRVRLPHCRRGAHVTPSGGRTVSRIHSHAPSAHPLHLLIGGGLICPTVGLRGMTP